jgi:DNA recombination protein RmuC
MEQLLPLIYIIAGVVLGFVAASLILRGKADAEYQRGAAEAESMKQSLLETIKNLQTQKEELATEKAALIEKLDLLGIEKSELIARASTAEERSKLVADKEAVIAERDKTIAELMNKQQSLAAELSGMRSHIETEKKAMAEKLELLNQAQTVLSDTFKALSSEALKNNNDQFLQLAKTNMETFNSEAKGDLEKRQKAIEELLKPMNESLKKVDTTIVEIENKREQAYGQITEQVKRLYETEQSLRSETSNLVKALRTPQGRGQWGEIQLRRVVEMAGMQEYCDFDEQHSVNTDDGKQRPDMIIKLPGNKRIVIDAKAVLSAYLDALDEQDETARELKLAQHAVQVRSRVAELSRKEYWNQFENAPDFVVMFMPTDAILTAALLKDGGLFEDAIKSNILLVTPVTLIALLKSAAYGWQQEALAQNAMEIKKVGQELYKRLNTLSEYVSKVGKNLSSTVENYNKMVSSMETRLLPSTKRLMELKVAANEESIEMDQVSLHVKPLSAPELIVGNDEDNM